MLSYAYLPWLTNSGKFCERAKIQKTSKQDRRKLTRRWSTWTWRTPRRRPHSCKTWQWTWKSSRRRRRQTRRMSFPKILSARSSSRSIQVARWASWGLWSSQASTSAASFTLTSQIAAVSALSHRSWSKSPDLATRYNTRRWKIYNRTTLMESRFE